MMNNQTIERGIDMDVEIFSLTGKNSADLSQTSGEIAKKLEQNGFSVTRGSYNKGQHIVPQKVCRGCCGIREV